MVCLLWLELMCWPLTRRGGHTATTKETERTPDPGGPVGAMRRNDRERRRDRSRRAGMIDAARRWKARATAGCAQAPDRKPQAGPRISTATHDRADSPTEAGRSSSDRPKRPSPFAKVEEDQRVGFETVLTLTWLSANRRLPTRQMVAERGGTPNGLRGRGEPSCDGRREIVEMRD